MLNKRRRNFEQKNVSDNCTDIFDDRDKTTIYEAARKYVGIFDEAKNNPALQAQVVRESNRFEDRENDMFNHKDYDDRDDR